MSNKFIKFLILSVLCFGLLEAAVSSDTSVMNPGNTIVMQANPDLQKITYDIKLSSAVFQPNSKGTIQLLPQFTNSPSISCLSGFNVLTKGAKIVPAKICFPNSGMPLYSITTETGTYALVVIFNSENCILCCNNSSVLDTIAEIKVKDTGIYFPPLPSYYDPNSASFSKNGFLLINGANSKGIQESSLVAYPLTNRQAKVTTRIITGGMSVSKPTILNLQNLIQGTGSISPLVPAIQSELSKNELSSAVQLALFRALENSLFDGTEIFTNLAQHEKESRDGFGILRAAQKLPTLTNGDTQDAPNGDPVEAINGADAA